MGKKECNAAPPIGVVIWLVCWGMPQAALGSVKAHTWFEARAKAMVKYHKDTHEITVRLPGT